MNPWLLGGSALALVLMYAGWSIQVSNIRAEHAFLIGQEQKATADTKGAWDAYKLQVEQQIGSNASARVRELSAALDRASELQAEVDRLRGLYAQAQAQSEAKESERVRELNNAKKDQDSLLDARTRDYYRRLRSEQLAAAKARSDPPSP